MSEIQPSAVTKVARDLREIERMHAALFDRAVDMSRSRDLPGGDAMAALGNVGSPGEWAELLAAEELYHLSMCAKTDHRQCRYAFVDEDDEEHEPPLQTLLFWSEAWRAEHGYELGRRPTIRSEVNFIRGVLDWAWDNEVHFDDFAADVRKVRSRLENLLRQGIRSERGAPCLYDQCRGVRLVRKLEPKRDEDGEKVWVLGDWHCPRCHRSWTEERYAAMVTAANEAAKVEDIDGRLWVAVDYAVRKVGVKAATLRSWMHRREVEVLCVIRGRRKPFVRLDEIEQRHEQAKRRKRAA